jgi:S-adenosylmethionine hydrolase
LLILSVLATDSWGDVITNIEPRHLNKIGIKHGDSFKVEFGGKRFLSRGNELKLLYGGNSFLSVNQGELFAFDEARGFISMSANGYAKVAKITELANIRNGDAVHILRPVGLGAALTGIPGGVLDTKAFEKIRHNTVSVQ